MPRSLRRIHSYELAFRMQMAAPGLLDFSSEPASTLEMYGVNQEPTHPYAVNCLLARRMVERGVRFVMLAHASWDDHQELDRKLKKNCDMTDRPAAALIKDLKQRGLLDSTLVIWGGEFGRTPMGQFERLDEAVGPRSSPQLFQHVAGWRWDQRRPGRRQDRRSGPSMSRRTKSTFTTCRRQSCIVWALIILA